MKLILRKVDSATSLLLFIYGFKRRFKKETNEELKLSSILNTMKLFGKNDSAVRMALSRAVKSGFFKNSRKENQVYYSPTTEGKRFIIAYEKETDSFLKRLRLRNSQWDKTWYLLNLVRANVLNTDKKKKFDQSLQLFGLIQISSNIWISPYDISDEISSLGDEFEIPDMTLMLHGEMTISGDLKEFLCKILKIDDFNKTYRDFISHYGEKLNLLESSYNKEHFIKNEIAIPLFYELGLTFLNFAFSDPLLPKEILPEWEGDRAAAILLGLMEKLMPSVENYFKQI